MVAHCLSQSFSRALAADISGDRASSTRSGIKFAIEQRWTHDTRGVGGDPNDHEIRPQMFQLGYVALETTDIERSKEHYIETIGMTETGKDAGMGNLSVGYEHHNIVSRQGQKKALLHLGYQLKPGTDLKDFAKEAQDYGVGAESTLGAIGKLMETQPRVVSAERW